MNRSRLELGFTASYHVSHMNRATLSVGRYGLYITPIQILQFILCLGILMPEARHDLHQTVSTRILGRRTAPFSPFLIPNRVSHGVNPRP